MRPTSSLPRRSSNKAAALIIVLAFVVILTGLAVAYLSRATTDRQLAHTSFHDTDADLLARSALDAVVGGFKWEIVKGSNGTTGTTVSDTIVYIPNSAANVVPKRSGNPAIPGGVETNDPIPNLIRRSVYPDTLNGTLGVGSRASAVNSTTASANGRSVSLARWNSHYLIPRANPLDTTGDSTPVSDFVAPDWVLVTRDGPAVFSAWDNSLKDPTVSPTVNLNYVVGRYAYAVYDEGGLLDINVAGYPSPTPAEQSLTAGPSVRDVGRKGVLAFADLTALPTTPGNYVSGTAINTLIGFRNYATMQLSGVSGFNFSPFSDTAVSNFFNYFTMPTPIPAASPRQIGTSKDFGVVNNVRTGSLSDSSLRTDQNFITRAELINLVKSLVNAGVDINVNTLQYLGTFSREKNKPTLPLTPAGVPNGWPSTFTRVVLPQRFYLGNLNNIWGSFGAGGPSWVASPPTASQATNIQTYLGLRFASATQGVPDPPECDNQVRWKYVGQDSNPAATPRPDISPFPSDPSNLTTLDFFQYINYALFGVTGVDPNNSAHFPFTLQIGASIIDQYDNDQLTTGIYFSGGSPSDPPCDPDATCMTFGADGSTPPLPQSCVTLSAVPPYATSGVFASRPLRSVGELGYAYNLLDAINNHNGGNYLTDFKDPYDSVNNPDPALLDFFTYNSSSGYQGAPVRSGIVNLNTRQPPVLAAILKGAIYNKNSNDADYTSGVVGMPGVNTATANLDATNAANSIVNETWNLTPPHGPALSRADIARLASASVVTTSPFTSNEEARDTIARALSEVVQTRTWGLLIDVVAQTGHYPPNADQGPNTTNPLANFVVEGEKRYWLHIAIDRFEGPSASVFGSGTSVSAVTVLGQQLEEVTE